MGGRTLPGLNLKGFWTLGFDGWKDDMDANLRVLSAISAGYVKDSVTALPGVPADGDIHLRKSDAGDNPNAIAIRDAGAWIHIPPFEGLSLYNRATDTLLLFDGVSWNPFAAGLPDAPQDGVRYVRRNGQWVPALATSAPTESLLAALGTETTAITTGTAKVTLRAPYAMTLTRVRASLTTASSSGIVSIDIKKNGVSILSTKLTIDAGEKTSTTAAVAVVISTPILDDDSEITFDIDGAGTGATGLKIALIGNQ